MRVLCFGYRPWALKIYQNIKVVKNAEITVIESQKRVCVETIEKENPDLILFYGWSWKIDPAIIQKHKCLMLHPSELPKYRGGSPIQNQVIDGVRLSAVTVFRMTEELDAGPILKKAPLTLDGEVEEIFKKMIIIGTSLTIDLLQSYPSEEPQIPKDATYCVRRTPEMSEITVAEIESRSAKYLYDKIRCLTGPYPRAYIRAGDGQNLFIERASLAQD